MNALKALVLIIFGYVWSLINSIDAACTANREMLIKLQTQLEIVIPEITAIREIPETPDVQP